MGMKKKIQYWFARLFIISILGDCLLASSSMGFHSNLNKPYILTAHRRGCFARWKKKAGMTNVDHLSRRIFSFFSREKVATSMFRFRLVRAEKKPTQQPNLFSSFLFSRLWGGKG